MTRLLLVPVLLCALAWSAAAIEIGDAASLPWEGDAEHGLRLDYDLEKLPADTLALLGDDVSPLVRYETLRRAAAYLSLRGASPEQAAPIRARLQAALDAREKEAPSSVLRQLDAACFRKLTGLEKNAPALVEMTLAHGELPYVLYRVWGDERHFAAALDGAREGSVLARNLLSDFGHEYADLAALRKGLEPPEEDDFFPDFPYLPPVPDADPSIRYGVTLLAPWRLVLRRTDDEGIAVTWTKETPWRVRITQGHHMVLGTRIRYRVYVDGKSVERHESDELTSAEPLWAADATSFLQDVPAGAIVKAHAEIFETDIPGQHLWSPTGGKYRVLWTHTYEARVP